MEGQSVTLCSEKLFKVLVIGDLGVGKSCIIRRYVNRRFQEGYKPTMGVDFALKTIEWDQKTVVRMQLWDIAGQERFMQMSRVYYKRAMGALVVFDITNHSSLKAAAEWKQDLDSKVGLDGGRPVPAVLLANKCDLPERDGDVVASLDSFCEEQGFKGWFETSAKGNVNIDEAGAFLVQQMMLCEAGLSAEEEQQEDVIKVIQPPRESPGKMMCCWRP